MKNWRQWPWKQWAKMYLVYLSLWLAFDILFKATGAFGEEKSWTSILLAAPSKALFFTIILEVISQPKSVRKQSMNSTPAESKKEE